MGSMLGLVELLLVLGCGVVWAAFELRSLRRGRTRPDPATPRSPNTPPP